MLKSMRPTRCFFCSHNKLRQICPYFKTYSEFPGSESKTSLSTFAGVISDDATSLDFEVNFVDFFIINSISFSNYDNSYSKGKSGGMPKSLSPPKIAIVNPPTIRAVNASISGCDL